MGGWIKCRGERFVFSLIIVSTLWCPCWTNHGIAIADQKAEAPAFMEEQGATASGEATEYHTPLAGEPFRTVIMGNSTLVIVSIMRRMA